MVIPSKGGTSPGHTPSALSTCYSGCQPVEASHGLAWSPGQRAVAAPLPGAPSGRLWP